MVISGLDFTSVPCAKKPLSLADCELDGDCLCLLSIRHLDSFEKFEQFLNRPGPWIGALDFPFGQPIRLICNLGWPSRWEDYVQRFAERSRDEFVCFMRGYQDARPKGDKQHFRAVDRLAKSCSPMKLDFTPVGRMFYQGAPRLLRSDCDILPFRKNRSDRIVVEGYPALVARCCVGKKPYKSDTRNKQVAAHKSMRQAIVNTLVGDSQAAGQFVEKYGFKVSISSYQRIQLASDPTGDDLDAVLCAVQAAWSFRNRDQDFGIPKTANLVEGWIVDPHLCLSSHLAQAVSR